MKIRSFIVCTAISALALALFVSCKKDNSYDGLPTFNYNGKSYKVAPSSDNEMNWSVAADYCENYSIDGVTGWRLTTRGELIQMYQVRKEIGGFLDRWYWSCSGDEVSSYCVSFFNGEVMMLSDNYTAYVRPIREEYSTVDNDDDTYDF